MCETCFRSRGRMVSFPAMKRLALVLTLLGLSCTVSPVITEPSSHGGRSDRYDNCRHASRDYCREVLNKSDDVMKKCVDNFTYECLTGGGGE